MVTLNDGIKQIAYLAEKKGWGSDVATKIFYAIIELGEAGDIWKHRGDEAYLLEMGLLKEEVKRAVSVELIDAIFYCLHGLHCLGVSDADAIFDQKMVINQLRQRVYNDDTDENIGETT